MRAEMARLASIHPSVGDHRALGLFGIMELRRDAKGTPLAPYNGSHPAMNQLAKFFRAEGLFTFVRWNNFMCNPPSASLKSSFWRVLRSSTADCVPSWTRCSRAEPGLRTARAGPALRSGCCPPRHSRVGAIRRRGERAPAAASGPSPQPSRLSARSPPSHGASEQRLEALVADGAPGEVEHARRGEVSSERRAVRSSSEGVLGQVDGHEALERAGAEQVPEVPAREPRAPQRQDSQLAQVGGDRAAAGGPHA
jgi:hypothetical protein